MVRLKINFSNPKLVERRLRTAGGAYLIELLAALFIAGMLSVVLSSSLSQVIRLSSATDRNLLAASAAQAVIERIRATPYDELPPSGNYDVQVNLGGTSDVQVTPTAGFIAQRPTMLDGTRLVWSATQPDGSLPNNRFQGSVTLAISDLDVSDAKRILVHVSWNDSTSRVKRTYDAGTIIAKNGIMRHP